MLCKFLKIVQGRIHKSLDQRESGALSAIRTDRRGVASIEYAMIVSIFSAAIIGGGSMVSSTLHNLFFNISQNGLHVIGVQVAGGNARYQTCSENIRGHACEEERVRP